jgi:hypothetical protein
VTEKEFIEFIEFVGLIELVGFVELIGLIELDEFGSRNAEVGKNRKIRPIDFF